MKRLAAEFASEAEMCALFSDWAQPELLTPPAPKPGRLL